MVTPRKPGAVRGRPRLKKSERRVQIRGSLSPDAARVLRSIVRAALVGDGGAVEYDDDERREVLEFARAIR